VLDLCNYSQLQDWRGSKMIEAALGAAGSLVSGIFGQSSANRSIKFQREAAKNAHQWEVEDLRKAGLNPILSAGGSGARASGGAQATMPDLGSAVTTALAAKRLNQEIKNLKAQERKTGAEEQNVKQNMKIARPAALLADDSAREYLMLKGVTGVTAKKLMDSYLPQKYPFTEPQGSKHPSGKPKNRRKTHKSFKRTN